MKWKLFWFLIEVKGEGKMVVGYGVFVKGNILLNYCGVWGDFIDYMVDWSYYKQGLFLLGIYIFVC